jgi:hypothetical protein
MLGRPYPPDLAKGPFTVTTVKIPTALWERLGWVVALTGQAKQDVLAEALKDRLEKVREGR